MSSHKIDQRTERLLLGALRVWGVRGSVLPDGDGLMVRTDSGAEMRIVRAAPHGWRVRRDGTLHAGLPGLLRHLREELAPDAPRGRLIIGKSLP